MGKVSKIQERIRALLAKAIGTSFPEERKIFAEKAFSQAVKHHRVVQFQTMLLEAGIEKALLEKAVDVEMASTSSQVDEEEEVRKSEPFIHDPYMTWTTIDGRTSQIRKMDTMHLINIRNYLKRKDRTHGFVYRNIVAEIESRGPEFPWKVNIRYRKKS